jgi:hypothetical protein
LSSSPKIKWFDNVSQQNTECSNLQSGELFNSLDKVNEAQISTVITRMFRRSFLMQVKKMIVSAVGEVINKPLIV